MIRKIWSIIIIAILLSLLLIPLLGCASDESTATTDKLPLATWDPSTSDAFDQTSAGKGILSISDTCVLLTLENQKEILLVWPEPTSWNASTQAIEFVDVRGEHLQLRDGDYIIPGGVTVVGGGNPGEPELGEPQYVSSPNDSCEADEIFVVNSVRLASSD